MEVQNFGTKDLYEVVLRANNPMVFGEWSVESGEPVLILSNVQASLLEQKTTPVIARGGRGNLAQIVWESKSDVTFSCANGVMNQVGMRLLLGSNLAANPRNPQTRAYKIEDLELDENGKAQLMFLPIPNSKVFCFLYSDENRQNKIDFVLNEQEIDCGIDYAYNKVLIYYEFYYGKEALLYTINKKSFNGVFSLEAKFYVKDENFGVKSTNIIRMPKVKIVSNFSFQLGDRVDPLVSSFNLIAMPSSVDGEEEYVMTITQLSEDIDGDI